MDTVHFTALDFRPDQAEYLDQKKVPENCFNHVLLGHTINPELELLRVAPWKLHFNSLPSGPSMSTETKGLEMDTESLISSLREDIKQTEET